MKRGITIALFFILLISLTIVVPAEDAAPAGSQAVLKGISSEAGAKSNIFLEKEIQIPTSLELAARIVLGIKQEQSVSFEELIVLAALWIFILLIIASIVGFIPLFSDKGMIKWAASIVIMLLTSIGGGFYQGALFILGFVNLFAFTSKNKMLGMFLAIVIIGILGWGVTKILGKLKREVEVENAEQIGSDVGAELKKRKLIK